MTGRRRYTAADNIRPNDFCLECLAAEVTHLELRCIPDPTTGQPVWLHGEALRRWYARRADVGAQFRALTAKGAMPGGNP